METVETANLQQPSQAEPHQDGHAQSSSPAPSSDSPSDIPSDTTSDLHVPLQSDSDVPAASAIAIVRGESVLELPKDLYIPPQALQIFLEAFEGPLDLLLYLIKRHNLDILDIPILDITKQYMEYVDVMQEIQFELAAEYLLMAAMLAEIKSRMLLPRPEELQADELDPRAELIRRLQEYERFKTAAMAIDDLPREGRDRFAVTAQGPDVPIERPLPNIDLQDLVIAFQDVMRRVKLVQHHQVQREKLTVNERMSMILNILLERGFIEFTELLNPKEGRQGVVVSFLATLELLKQSLIDIVQKEPYSPLHIKGRG